MIEEIRHQDRLLAIIVSHRFDAPGIHFVTPNGLSQQLAHMRRPKGYVIESHVHLPVPREVQLTQETLFIKRGRVRVDFYDDAENYLESRVLGPGDAILLVQGGHGFEALEELEMLEVKQGPYAGAEDKRRFVPRRPAQFNYGPAGPPA